MFYKSIAVQIKISNFEKLFYIETKVLSETKVGKSNTTIPSALTKLLSLATS